MEFIVKQQTNGNNNTHQLSSNSDPNSNSKAIISKLINREPEKLGRESVAHQQQVRLLAGANSHSHSDSSEHDDNDDDNLQKTTTTTTTRLGANLTTTNKTQFGKISTRFPISGSRGLAAAAAAAEQEAEASRVLIKGKSRSRLATSAAAATAQAAAMPISHEFATKDNESTGGVGSLESAAKKMSHSAAIRTKTKPTCGRLLIKWILLFLMGIFIFSIVALSLYLTITLLDNEDQCFHKNLPFQQTSYKLFSTKTLYTTTFNYLNRHQTSLSPALLLLAPQPQATPSFSSISSGGGGGGGVGNGGGGPPNSNNNNNNNNNINIQQQQQQLNRLNYDKSSIHLPKIFSQQDSLETINSRLLSAEFGCKVVQLHYIGRHAARLPSSKELDKINRHIQSIQSRINPANIIDDSNSQQQQPQSQPIIRLNHQLQQSQSNQANQQAAAVTNDGTTNKSAEAICSDPLVEFKQWTSFASPEQGNLLIETGIRETEAIARRYKSIFPEMFDNNLTKIEIGTTEELRTAQTALAFMKQFANFSLDFCDLDDFPIENTADKTRAYEIHHSVCYRNMLKRFAREKLSFHKVCEQLHREELKISHNLNLRHPNRTDFIAKSVSKKLKLSQDSQLTSEEAYTIYEICRYESALTGSTSIWCNLFNEKELRFYEYLNDIDDFYQVYGHADQARSACPVTRDLARSFKLAKKQQATGQQQPEAHFYFTHSQVIQKILAASVDLSQDPEFSPSTILDNLNRGQAPKLRQWQTSLFTPFSANIAFTLYSCPRVSASSSSSSPPSSDLADTLSDFDVTANPFKVVASLNEQPILLEGCSDYVCDLPELLYNGRLNAERSCKMNEICRNNIVVT